MFETSSPIRLFAISLGLHVALAVMAFALTTPAPDAGMGCLQIVSDGGTWQAFAQCRSERGPH